MVHFSSCDIMKGNVEPEIIEGYPEGTVIKVSGYRASVDWTNSVVFEFLYLESAILILGWIKGIDEKILTY